MILAVMADTHDNRTALRRALELARGRGAAETLHGGDLTSSSMIEMFRGWTLHYVSGNMDRDAGEIRAAVGRLGMGSRSGEELHLERDGLRIALMHGNRPDRMAAAAQSGSYDFIFSGHTHIRRDERIGRTRAVNPGALGGASAGRYSFCLLDTSDGGVEFVEV
jgi:putative phosphoesterase